MFSVDSSTKWARMCCNSVSYYADSHLCTCTHCTIFPSKKWTGVVHTIRSKKKVAQHRNQNPRTAPPLVPTSTPQTRIKPQYLASRSHTRSRTRLSDFCRFNLNRLLSRPAHPHAPPLGRGHCPTGIKQDLW